MWQKHCHMWCWEHHNVKMEPSNVIKKKKKGITECDKRKIKCDIGAAQCKNKIVKCEKKNKWTTQCDKRIVTCDIGTTQCENETVKCEEKK